jgi:chromosome partitioning protein
MGKVIAIFNQKGGIGKTTTTMNLGWALINKKKKVLMIDLDPQSSLTISMHLEPKLMKTTMYDVLTGESIEKAMLTDGEYFYFLPNSVHLSALEDELKNKQLLKKALEPIINEFDYILIDCPPSLSNLSILALAASDYIIIPMQTDYLCWCGYELLMDSYNTVKKINPKLEIMGILPTMHRNTRHSKEMLEVIQKTGKAFKTIIGDYVAFKDSTVEGVPICDYDKKLGKLYVQLANEVINYGKETVPSR